MANFFSADYWKALYFKAMGGQETAVDPNAMSGTFAGSSTFTGTLDQPALSSGPSQDFRNVLDGVLRTWPISAVASVWQRERKERLDRAERERFEAGSISGSFAGSSSFSAKPRYDEDEIDIMILMLAA